MLRRAAWAWLPALLGLGAFLPALRGGFLMIDDDWLVADNAAILRPSAADLRAILDPFRPREPFGHEYLPLRDLSYTLDAAVARLAGAPLPAVCHASQSLLHALNCLLAALLAARLTGRRTWGFLCGALFALHPVHAEAVCWISSRKDLLGTAFALFSVLCWRRRRLAASWLAFVAAMLCKATMTVVPALLLASDLCFPPDGRWRARDALRLLPFAAALLPMSAIHVTHAMHGLISTAIPGIGWGETALTMARCAVRYLVLLSMGLTGRATYRPEWSEGLGAPEAGSLLLLGALALLTAALAAGALRGRLSPRAAAVGFGLLWSAAAMAPVSNLLYRSLVLMADRYLYLPSFGACLATAALLGAVPLRRGTLAAGALAAACLLVRDVRASGNWLGNLPVCANGLRQDPRHDYYHSLWGRDAAFRRAWGESLAHYRKAAVLVDVAHQNPIAAPSAVRDEASVLIEVGRADEAVRRLETVLRGGLWRPLLLGSRGRAHAAAGRAAEAERDCRERVRLAPWQADGWLDLAIQLNNAGKLPEALAAADHACALAGDPPAALYYRGIVRANLGERGPAEEDLGRALARSEGRFPAARAALASLHLLEAEELARARRLPEARERIARARALSGRTPAVEHALGVLAREAQDWPEAERRFRRAIAGAGDPAYRTDLAELLRAKGVRAMVAKPPDLEAAWAAYREALAAFPEGTDATGVRAHLALVSDELLRRRFEAAAKAFREGRMEEARRGFVAALEIRPGHFESQYNLGLACANLAEWREAVDALKEAVRLRPGDAEAERRLAEAERRLEARPGTEPTRGP